MAARSGWRTSRFVAAGIRRVLMHLGLLADDDGLHPPPGSGATLLEIPGSRAFVYATTDGIFEPFHPNGRTVQAGEAAGRIHRIWEPAQPPVTLYYRVRRHSLWTPSSWSRPTGELLPGSCFRLYRPLLNTATELRTVVVKIAAAIQDARLPSAIRSPAARDHASHREPLGSPRHRTD